VIFRKERLEKMSVTFGKCVMFCAALPIFLLLSSVPAFGAPDSALPILFTQKNGDVISVANHGDEYLSWTQDAYGDLVAYSGGQYYYADWTADGAKAGHTPAAASKPDQPVTLASDIPPALLNRAYARHAADTAALTTYGSSGSSARMGIFGSAQTPDIEEVSPGGGTFSFNHDIQRNVLAVYVTWDDTSDFTNAYTGGSITGKNAATQDEIRNLLFGDGSVNDYYEKMFGVSEKVIVPAVVSKKSDPTSALDGIITVSGGAHHPNPGVADENDVDMGTFIQVIMKNTLSVYDFTPYDTNHDGTLESDELVFVFILQGFEASSPGGDLVSPSVHGSMTYNAGEGVRFSEDMSINSYAVFGSNLADGHLITIGVICHELGHAVYNFVDLYDRDSSDGYGGGLGYWSLMNSGIWCALPNGEPGSCPAYVDAYNLVEEGLIIPKTYSAGDYAKLTSTGQMDIFKITTSTPSQYFLLQTREDSGYDRAAFNAMANAGNSISGGLLVYQIDEAVTTCDDLSSLYQVAVLEADGDDSMRLGKDAGALTDLWGNSQSTLSGSTTPNTNIYGIGQAKADKSYASGVLLSGIQFHSGNGTSFTLGTAPTWHDSAEVTPMPDRATYTAPAA
jgi:M6 family metalloprotease-like protein